MSQLNDCKLAALIAGGYGDQLNDAMLAWAQANGATSNQLNEAMLEAAQANGATSNDLNDALYEVLGLLGYTGSLNDRQLDFWCIGGGVLGFRALSATMGITNDLVVVTFSNVPQNFNPIAGLQITVAGVDQLNSAVAPTLLGNTLTYTLNVTASSVDEVRWVYSQPPGLISDGVSLAPTTDLLAQAEINPVFQVPLTSSLIPLRASNFNYTFARSGANATVTDFEGLVKDVTANEARFVGARRVHNLITASQDVQAATWAALGVTTVDADTFTYTAGTNTARLQDGAVVTGSAGELAGRTYVMSDTGSVDSGTGAYRFQVQYSGGVTAVSPDISIAVAPIRASFQNTLAGSGTDVNASIRNRAAGGVNTINGTGIQFEDVTGQAYQGSNPGAPSERVITGQGVDHGSNQDTVKYFATENGNTATSNVVTEATGSAIPAATLEGVLVEEQRTNYADTDDGLTGGAETIDITAGGTGDYTLSVFGSAAVTVAAGTATGSGFAQATEGNPVTFNITVVGTITLTLDSGTLDTSQAGDYLKQVEAGSFATTFIPSPTTTAATRNAEGLSYPNTNILDDEGTFAITFTPGANTADYIGDGDKALIGLRGVNNDLIHIDTTTGKLILSDGTNETVPTTLPALVAGTATNIAIRWSATAGTMTIRQDAVEVSATFDGSMNKSTPIYIGGLFNRANGSYKDVRGWPVAVKDLPTQLPA